MKKRVLSLLMALTLLCVPGGALALYSNRKLGYITSQVEAFLADWANFKPVSARS